MRKMAVLLLVFTFFNINSFAQESEIDPEIVDFVNNSEVVPDYTNEEGGWVFLPHASTLTEVPLLFGSAEDSDRDRVVLGITTRYYVEASSGLVTIVYSLVLDDRRDIEYGMLYGTKGVYRYAIKVEDVWEIAKKPGMPEVDEEHSMIHKDIPLFSRAPFDNKTGILIFVASLVTVDGIKTITIEVHMLEIDKKGLRDNESLIV